MADDRQQQAAMSRRQIRGDESHREGCGSGAFRPWERDTCGTCALLGWGAHDEQHPGSPAPNYAGWARTYVQAREPIPLEWAPALVAELADENRAYARELAADLEHYGARFTTQPAGYRLPVPNGRRLLAWVQDYHGPIGPAETLNVLAAMEADDDYDADSRRAIAEARELVRSGAPTNA